VGKSGMNSARKTKIENLARPAQRLGRKKARKKERTSPKTPVK
jgi:hypothetical protein